MSCEKEILFFFILPAYETPMRAATLNIATFLELTLLIEKKEKRITKNNINFFGVNKEESFGFD